MGVEYERALGQLESAAADVFGSDERVRSVGIGRHGSGFGYVAVRNAAAILPLGGLESIAAAVPSFGEIPVTYVDSHHDPESLVKVPHTGPGSPTAASLVAEQGRHRPLVCGLQIENFDDDTRTQVIQNGHIIVGTLGCFVTLQSGKKAILSNNHVVAGENRGQRSADRIMQAGTGAFSAADQAGTLTDFIDVQPSAPTASPARGGVNFNDVDAGVAELLNNVKFAQVYLSSRTGVTAPGGTAAAAVGDHVFKVGRTTGLTHGEVTQISTIVGPIPYAPGQCWFQNTLVIEGLNGTMFSDHGDSGSAVVRSDGKIVGLLFAGNGQQTYACDIALVLQALHCTIP